MPSQAWPMAFQPNWKLIHIGLLTVRNMQLFENNQPLSPQSERIELVHDSFVILDLFAPPRMTTKNLMPKEIML